MYMHMAKSGNPQQALAPNIGVPKMQAACPAQSAGGAPGPTGLGRELRLLKGGLESMLTHT